MYLLFTNKKNIIMAIGQIFRDRATVYAENGMHYVMINGVKIPGIVKTVVTDDCTAKSATVEVTLECNIVGSFEEALVIYNVDNLNI